ncbi:hypothetical protein E1091_00275 [Micromonospora fluostatini]|uniref:Uncharacterized protein n=1 Tax=Micromonospora fluostatini TaxID=1629071 RepID=A0ABY2DN36_9ACTN|nr:hypothetical protein E1091_00275 [Micromonospora fluostatini]
MIVRNVFDPERAAAAAEQQGQHERALLLRRVGAGCQVVATAGSTVALGGDLWFPVSPDRKQLDRLLDRINQADPLPGTRYHSRFDYDPDWVKQRAAVDEAMAAAWRERGVRRMVAVPAANAFARSYYEWDERWDLSYPTEKSWSANEQRNFSERAARLLNGIAGLLLVRGAAPADYVLHGAIENGWMAGLDDRYPEEANGRYTLGSVLEVAYGLAYVMAKYGERHPDWLKVAVSAGTAGNS